MPRVSVIIPAFQASRTIERAIRAVQGQTYCCWEILVVDDGSIDDTANITREIARGDSRIRYHYQQNQGQAAARNVGADLARGEYLAFLDADDEWKPGKLTEQIHILDTAPEVGLVLCDSVNINEAQNTVLTYSRQYERVLSSLKMRPILSANNACLIVDPTLRQILYRSNFVNTSTVVIRKELFDAVGRFNSRCRGAEDLDLWVRLAPMTTFGYLTSIYALRYKGASNVSARSETWLTEIIRFHRMYLDDKDYSDLHANSRSHLKSTYRNLLRWYGRNRKPRRAFTAFRESLDLGFDPRALVYVLGAFLGPIPFVVGGKISQILSRAWSTFRL